MATYKFTSHLPEITRLTDANVDRALTAMGIEATGCIKETMNSRYGRPIKKTGNLMGSIDSKKISADSVAVGTNVEYATFVHEGTSRMRGRPYIKDGILGNVDRLKAVMEQELKRGF